MLPWCVAFFLKKKICSLYCVFNLTFTVLKILWVLGKKGALGGETWTNNKRKKRSVSVVIPQKRFHAFKISFFSFCIFYWLMWSFQSMHRSWGSHWYLLTSLLPWLSSSSPLSSSADMLSSPRAILLLRLPESFSLGHRVGISSHLHPPSPPYLVSSSLFPPAIGIPNQELIFLLCSLG